MPQKSRIAIKELFTTGLLNEGDFIDFADSHFNLIDDDVDGSLIVDGSITLNELSASTLQVLQTPDGITAWTVNSQGDFLPFSSHFQDIGSALDTVKEIHSDNLFVYDSSDLPLNTTIGNVSATEISHLDGVTAPIQQQIDDIVVSGGGVLNYTHIQAVPSTTWTIVHNKNTENIVYTLLDENKKEFLPNSFRILDMDTVEFTFAANQLGKVNMIFY